MTNEPPSVYELDKRLSVMEAALQRLAADLESINRNLSKLVWIGLAALGAAVVQFVIRGGLRG